MRWLVDDARYALRVLAKAPGYTLAAVLTLALAIGAITTTFSVVDGVLLNPLPFPDVHRLIAINESSPSFENMSVAYDDLLDWRRDQKSFTSLAGFRTESRALTGLSLPENVTASLISYDLFDVLGVPPIAGRSFTPEEDKKGAPAPVAILGNGLWKSHFASDPAIVGHTITLDGKPYTVVGVASPKTTQFPGDLGVYLPIAFTQGPAASRGSHPGLNVVGRLKPGITLRQATEDLESIGRRLQQEFPRSNDGVLPKLRPMQERWVGDLRSTLVLLFAAAGFVLLIAIANVANLMLARGSVRRREMAVRAALGAGRGRLVRQLLVESSIVGLAAGAIGTLLSMWTVDYVSANRPDAIPQFIPISLDHGVLLFSVGVSLLAGLLFGLLPALQISRTDLAGALKEGDTRGGTAKGNRLRGALVVLEVALALVLLVGAGLAVRAFSRVLHVDTGMKPDHLLTFSYSLPKQKFDTAEGLVAFHQRIQARLEAIPGVKKVSLSLGMPLQGASETSFRFAGEPDATARTTKMGVIFEVGPSFFDTYGIQVIRGRGFTDADVTSGVQKVVVDENLAKKYLDPENPFSRRFADKPRPDGTTGDPIEIVGIVRHVAHYGLEGEEPTPYQFYQLWRDDTKPRQLAVLRGMDVAIRTDGDPAALTDTVRRAVSEVDPDLPIFDVQTMQQRVDDATSARRFSMTLLSIFAGLALVIAAMGLYAVIAYMVAQRTREIGIRIALGAQPAEVRRMVVVQGLRLTGLGLGVGLVAALALSSAMKSLFDSVSSVDPLIFSAVVLTLSLVAVLASWFPARRASRVQPMTALRQE